MKKQLTKKEWGEFVSKNGDNSYSLAVCLAIMLLWEEPNKEPIEVLSGLGLSGAQAEMAIGFTKEHNLAVTNIEKNPLIDKREDLLDNANNK